jgi:hypothetical protein
VKTSNLTTLEVTNNRSVLQMLVIANGGPSSPIFVTLIMEKLRSSETSVFTTATWRNIPEDGSLHCHRREPPNNSYFLYIVLKIFI